ncbi:hypothetical protein D7W79_11950 [Corallococcus exercitus]|uniref:Uncharacterized protein n=1 Tax=Corallococcus exercitus TaxID=2316736 RepID=A0A3A8I8D6_9BACT|nr:hypothetical protein [Corallococcus exercitus]NOK34440.1 hypothetical protein [Corallococcus exercitus]RKG78828.1 hypothetical protein D7W79_11950 [Corallococcus exercitus]
MRKLMMKSLLTVSAVLSLTPATALALFPDCDTWCTEIEHSIVPCSWRCTKPFTSQTTTCGEWVASYGYQYPDAVCAPGFAAPEASCDAVTQDSEEGSEEVCREPGQAEDMQP